MRLSLFVLLIACSKDAPTASLVAQSKAIVDKLCACRDAACATAAEAEWNEVAKAQPTRQLSADDVEALAAEAQRYAKCLGEVRK